MQLMTIEMIKVDDLKRRRRSSSSTTAGSTKIVGWMMIVFLFLFQNSFVSGFVVSSCCSNTKRIIMRRRFVQPREVVFTRLSEDCIRSLEVAEKEAFLLGQGEVNNSLMLFGVCDQPGKAKATMDRYKITRENVHRVLKSLFLPTPTATSSSSSSSSSLSSIPKLSDFCDLKKENPEVQVPPVPLSKSLQQSLNQAGKISEIMGSPSIQSEHVFLALLDYKEVGDGEEAQAAPRGDEDCEAMEIIWEIDAALKGEDVCHSLLQNLMEQKQQKQQQQQQDSDTTTITKRAAETNSQKRKRGKITTTPSKNSQTTTRTMTQKQSSNNKSEENDEEGQPPTVLQECSIDLTQEAIDGELDRIYGRDEEIESCLRILLRRRKNNICLIGEAGVGKTSIAEGLAQILVDDEKCPALLRGHRLISLQVGSLLSGTKFRGEFETKLRAIIEELKKGPQKSVLFVDDIHTLVGAGSTGGGGGGSMDAANLLKPYLARGKIQMMGATTITEYNKFISKDAALERRLQPVLIKEPTINETIGILQAAVSFYSQHHKVNFTPESLEVAAKLSDRYIQDRFLPDKAIDLIDEAGSLASLNRDITNSDLNPPLVTEKSITNIVSQWSNIPVGKLEMDDMERLIGLEDRLKLRVKGQERAVRNVAKAIRRARTGIRNPQRPIASFLFCGPTGTGKTEFCKALAATYFGSERTNLIRIDMSEYMDKYTVSRLTGPPPGFVGYEEGGHLTEAVRRAPHSVVLLDELEKAHGDVLNILLQVMEDGILTDGKGRTVSFKNTVLIMTSNIGSKRILELAQKQQQQQKSNRNKISSSSYYSKLARVVKSELEAVMKPEFLNRIDDIIVFQPLSENELSMIAAMMVVDIVMRAKAERDIDITVTNALLQKMVQEGSIAAGQFGARPMRRAVQRIFEDAISDSVVQGFLLAGDAGIFDIEDDEQQQQLIQEEEEEEEEYFDTTTDIAMDETKQKPPYYVIVKRYRDRKVLRLEVEESSRDLEETDDDDDDDDNDNKEEDADDLLRLPPNGESKEQHKEEEENILPNGLQRQPRAVG